jgi:hypothetical protein
MLEDIRPEGELSELSLLPIPEKVRRRGAEWRTAGRQAGGVVLLWLLVAASAALRLGSESRQVTAELQRLQEPRKALLAARLAMDSAGDMLRALDRARMERTRVVGQLAGIIGALPDSTVLTSLALDLKGSGTLTGRTSGVTGLLAALGRAPSVGPVQLSGATTRDSAGGTQWERFTLRLGSGSRP